MKAKAAQINMEAASTKYIIAPTNRLFPSFGGKAAKQIAPRTFMLMPLRPFPNMTAPMYLGGSIPAIPNTLPYRKPLMNPKMSIMMIQRANPVPGAQRPETIGSSMINTAIAIYPPVILMV
jgi:hypothetical protein